MSRAASGLLVGCLVSSLAAALQPSGAAITVFEGARLIAGDTAAPLEDAAFVVENGRFTRVDKKGLVPAPRGATRVDLTGTTISVLRQARRWGPTLASCPFRCEMTCTPGPRGF